MKLRARLYNKQRGRCFYCDRKCHMAKIVTGGEYPDAFTVDHVNRPYSLKLVVGACYACNTERGHLPAHEYVMVWAMRLESARLAQR